MAKPLTDEQIEAIADPWEQAAVLKAERASLRAALEEARELMLAVRMDERSIEAGLWQGPFLWRHLAAVDMALWGEVQKLTLELAEAQPMGSS